ncbi:transcriptional regulator [Cecembia sp.]|uniref:transcriptional regulator n=1 Tax=Cecembia sp. TaxID=1898110 RepID=UPI0025BF9960|nr:transcriptional regulator [Cecembia sp.]
MKITVLMLLILLIPLGSAFAQLSFEARWEVEAKYQENDFMVMQKPGGIIAFRAQPERGFNLRANFQYFTTNYTLEGSDIKEVKIKDNFDLVGYDLEGDYFYALMQRGLTASSERYLLEINIETDEANEIPLENIYPMDLKEFLVLNKKAIFLGNADLRPMLQIFDMEANNVFTVEGIYGKETLVLQLRKDSNLGIIDALISKRDKYKTKQVSILSFDENGTKIREVSIERLQDINHEIVEGMLTPIYNYQQSLIGTYGQRKREAYQGIYIADINEFGEYNLNYYTLEDFPNFYNYLNEKQRERKWRELERQFSKNKVPNIKPVFSAREIIRTDIGYLIYSDNFNATNPRYIPRDGAYANDAYRFNPNRRYFDGMNYGPAYGSQLFNTYRYGPFSWQQEGEYKFISAYLIYIGKEGQVIWDNAFNLTNRITSIPGKYGEISFDGSKLHYLYLDGIQVYMSYMKNGEILFENEAFEIQLIDENERIRDTQEQSLNLSWWYDNYYLLSGKQKVRFLGNNGKEETKEVFFLTKISVNGDLYNPED